MDIQTALSNLYHATRLAPLTADQHDKLRESAECLHAHINPPEQKKPKKAKPASSPTAQEAPNAEKS